MDDHPWMIFAPFSVVFALILDYARVIFAHFSGFSDIPVRFRMFPDHSGAFQIVLGAFRSGGSPE